MPDSINPSPNWIQRMLGQTPPDVEFDKRMLMAQNKMRTEMPNEMNSSTIQPTGMFGGIKDSLVKRIIGGVPVATTSPFGGITYNKELLSAMPQNELEDTLAHELTHVRQFNQTPIMKKLASFILPEPDEGVPEQHKKDLRMQGWEPSYRGKFVEEEAYGTEAMRKLARGEGSPYDINLLPDRIGPSSKTVKKLGVK